MNKQSFVQQILMGQNKQATAEKVKAFAPSNIALCKYWGKRNTELNLPVTSSLSISLGNHGTTTTLSVNNENHDIIRLNNKLIEPGTSFYQRAVAFLDLFRENYFFTIDSSSNIPVAAGLASSASGFASLTLALAKLYNWTIDKKQLSLLARLGSGSASRSLWHGFVEWHKGFDAFTSFAEPLLETWPELCVGLLIVDSREKSMASREAMAYTVNTSPLYKNWPNIVSRDLITLKHAIQTHDFELLAKTAENNAITMHDTMLAASPSVNYANALTINMKNRVKALRKEGITVYFTQDAGPNLKLLFLEDASIEIQKHFPNIELIKPFSDIKCKVTRN